MIYDCLFEISDSALNPFEMIYVLSLWNDKWLSFQNEQYSFVFFLIWYMTVISKWPYKIFVRKTIFVNNLESNPRDENVP